MKRELIFVDTETTGLDSSSDLLVELTYATIDSDPKTLWFGVNEVNAFIDDLIGFTKRGIAGRLSPWPDVEQFLKISDNNTMVAANPSFDKSFIQHKGLWRFHYRMLDIESYAMAVLGLTQVPSMKDIQARLTNAGFNITEPDHTSRNDVLAMRDSYLALRNISVGF